MIDSTGDTAQGSLNRLFPGNPVALRQRDAASSQDQATTTADVEIPVDPVQGLHTYD